MNKNMNNITLDDIINSKMTFPLHSNYKRALIFAMLYWFSWLVLYAVYNINGINKNIYTDKLRYIAFIITDESHSIMNAILRSLSAFYGSVF